MITQKPEGYITIEEASKLLGVCRRTIIRLIEKNLVISVKLVNKRVFVEKASLLKYGGEE